MWLNVELNKNTTLDSEDVSKNSDLQSAVFCSRMLETPTFNAAACYSIKIYFNYWSKHIQITQVCDRTASDSTNIDDNQRSMESQKHEKTDLKDDKQKLQLKQKNIAKITNPQPKSNSIKSES